MGLDKRSSALGLYIFMYANSAPSPNEYIQLSVKKDAAIHFPRHKNKYIRTAKASIIVIMIMRNVFRGLTNKSTKGQKR